MIKRIFVFLKFKPRATAFFSAPAKVFIRLNLARMLFVGADWYFYHFYAPPNPSHPLVSTTMLCLSHFLNFSWRHSSALVASVSLYSAIFPPHLLRFYLEGRCTALRIESYLLFSSSRIVITLTICNCISFCRLSASSFLASIALIDA